MLSTKRVLLRNRTSKILGLEILVLVKYCRKLPAMASQIHLKLLTEQPQLCPMSQLPPNIFLASKITKKIALYQIKVKVDPYQ
jgi:hypothetical protein